MTFAHDRVVYGFADPDTREMRYIGKTITGMRRIWKHAYKARSGSSECPHLYNWMRSLTVHGKAPVVVAIEYVDCGGDIDTTERGWIAYFRALGCDLTNRTDGGDGGLGRPMSDAMKQQLRERALSPDSPWKRPDHAAKIAAAKTGKPRHDMRGDRSFTKRPEVRAKISAAKKGRSTGTQSAETIAKRSATLRGRRRSPEVVARVREARWGKS